MKIKPILDRVVLLPKKSEEKKGGILIPSVAQEKSQVATVMAVGDGMTADGKEVKMLVKAGDTVLFSKYAGVEVESDGKTYVIVRQADILAVID
ncbi:MAG TPA: co-chaperone GroES [Clostridiales bacterium]|nr:co-chaperone GroES [Clostridiales bacterium]